MKLFNLKNFKITHKGLYWGLIATFALLYLCVGFVSTLHSITFFGLANTLGLAVLLGLTYEVGQASVLFSILMSEKNKNKFLPWLLMFLLTALQVTANVYASFKFMANSGNNDWQYWQKSILIGVQAANPEMYQVIISWIAGALLPVVALGMTALVAQNMRFIAEEEEEKPKEITEDEAKAIKEFMDSENKKEINSAEEMVGELKKEKPKFSRHEILYPDVKENPETFSRDEHLENLKEKILSNAGKQTKLEESPIIGEGGVEIIKPEFQTSLSGPNSIDSDGVIWRAGEHPKVDFPLPSFKFTPPPPPAPEISKDKLDEIVENEVKRRLKEINNGKKEEDIQIGKTLDEDVERLIPVVDLPIETKQVEAEVKQIPVDVVAEMGEPEIVIPKELQKQTEDAMRRELGEKIPFTKTRGWHLKKEYVDSNGDVYHFGKFSPQEKRAKPEESKKA